MIYKIKYKRFVDGVWDAKFRTETVYAENEYQAVWHMGQQNGSAYPEKNIEDVIVMVSEEGGNDQCFQIGNSYLTSLGDTITIKGFSNIGTSYETAYDQYGYHRYSKRALGRCTGCSANDPRNVKLGVFWLRYDPADPYDYIMERKENPRD